MANKIRKQIYIDAVLDKQLKHLSAQTGESEASIIRRAIERFVAANTGGSIRRPLGPPDSWRRAVDRMRRSRLTPRPGVKLFDREALHER